VKDPDERLGAGKPGSENDIQALRLHPFLSTIAWDTLWSDPVPPLEPGLVKRIPEKGETPKWEDINTAWDELVVSEDDDEIEWADAETHNHQAEPDKEAESVDAELAQRRPLVRQDTASTIQPTSTLIGNPTLESVPRSSPLSETTGAHSFSSTEDCPQGQKSEAPEATVLHASQPAPPVVVEDEDDRGRNKALSPVQGNGPPSNINL
jgi:3-phosphoinositide dependent protein kinase-1